MLAKRALGAGEDPAMSREAHLTRMIVDAQAVLIESRSGLMKWWAKQAESMAPIFELSMPALAEPSRWSRIKDAISGKSASAELASDRRLQWMLLSGLAPRMEELKDLGFRMADGVRLARDRSREASSILQAELAELAESTGWIDGADAPGKAMERRMQKLRHELQECAVVATIATELCRAAVSAGGMAAELMAEGGAMGQGAERLGDAAARAHAAPARFERLVADFKGQALSAIAGCEPIERWVAESAPESQREADESWAMTGKAMRLRAAALGDPLPPSARRAFRA